MEYEDIFNVLDPNNRVAVVENDYSSTLKVITTLGNPTCNLPGVDEKTFNFNSPFF